MKEAQHMDEVKPIMTNHYGLKVLSIEKVRGVHKVGTSYGMNDFKNIEELLDLPFITTSFLNKSFLSSSIFAYDDKKEMEQPQISFPVISDTHILNSPSKEDQKLRNALVDLHELNPKAPVLVINGDMTDRGFESEYAHLREILDQSPVPNQVFFSIGNHEFNKAKWIDENHKSKITWPNSDTEHDAFQRFYNFTGLNKTYYEKIVKGYPFLFIGTEKYMRYHDSSLKDQAYLSQKQLDWLKKRLEHHSKEKKPIFVFSHFPLSETVSGTYPPEFRNKILQEQQLLDILKENSQVILFTSHTHWDLHSTDWAVRKMFPDGKGFSIVNTGAVEKIDSGDGKGGIVSHPDKSQGLYVEVYKSHVLIKARDFYRKRWIQEYKVKLP
jgi:3',5'-cyclic AMP phosphodiesterase CpdA